MLAPWIPLLEPPRNPLKSSDKKQQNQRMVGEAVREQSGNSGHLRKGASKKDPLISKELFTRC